MKPFHCEICGRPDWVECDMAKHTEHKRRKMEREIAKEEPEELLP
jgi:hypothetical protein